MKKQGGKRNRWVTIVGVGTLALIACVCIGVVVAMLQEIGVLPEPTKTEVDVMDAARQTLDARRAQYTAVDTMPSRLIEIATDTQQVTPQDTEEPTQTPLPCTCKNPPDLDCGDFLSPGKAQACFDYCLSIGAGDVYGLDRDSDGRVCEN